MSTTGWNRARRDRIATQRFQRQEVEFWRGALARARLMSLHREATVDELREMWEQMTPVERGTLGES